MYKSIEVNFLCLQGGIYMLEIMDTYSGGWSILFIAIFECISVGWIYGKVLFFIVYTQYVRVLLLAVYEYQIVKVCLPPEQVYSDSWTTSN